MGDNYRQNPRARKAINDKPRIQADKQGGYSLLGYNLAHAAKTDFQHSTKQGKSIRLR